MQFWKKVLQNREWPFSPNPFNLPTNTQVLNESQFLSISLKKFTTFHHLFVTAKTSQEKMMRKKNCSIEDLLLRVWLVVFHLLIFLQFQIVCFVGGVVPHYSKAFLVLFNFKKLACLKV